MPHISTLVQSLVYIWTQFPAVVGARSCPGGDLKMSYDIFDSLSGELGSNLSRVTYSGFRSFSKSLGIN
jgi:hypothetical protein